MGGSSLNETKQNIAIAVEKHMKCVVTGCVYLGSCSDGQAFRVTMNVPPFAAAVKVYFSRGAQEREAFSLRLLKRFSPIHLPEVYFTHAATKEQPVDFLCMELISGRDAFSDRRFLIKSRERRERFADLVTEALISIHENEGSKFGTATDPIFESWLSYYKPTAEAILRRAREKTKNGRFDKKAFGVMENAWCRFDEIFSEEVTCATLIHGDMSVKNIMTDRTTHLPVAFIGAAHSMYADRDYELFRLNSLNGDKFGLYDTYKAKTRVSDKCDLKCAFYRLWDEAMVCIKTGRRKTPAMSTAAKDMEKRLLAEEPKQLVRAEK